MNAVDDLLCELILFAKTHQISKLGFQIIDRIRDHRGEYSVDAIFD